MTHHPILDIEKLDVRYGSQTVLHSIDLQLPRGDSVGIVGESGSGKSTLAWAILGLLPPGGVVSGGSLRFNGQDILGQPARALRGGRIAMVFQDPFTALNPSLPIGRQITEVLIERGLADAHSARAEALRLMDEVRLPRAETLLHAYPHQLSGGMKQRVVIATALACSPELLLLDEPTTALDVTVEARILDLLDELRKDRGLSMMFISHNIGLVERMCSRVTVLRHGKVQESGPATQVLWQPHHAYTRKLLAALPRLRYDQPPAPAPAAVIAQARNVSLSFRSVHPLGGLARVLRLPEPPGVAALSGVSLALHPGEVVGLVGESGSGKSTLGRCLIGLQAPDTGQVELEGHDIYAARGATARQLRRRSQMVFQNPDSSLNPRHRIGEVLRRPLQLLGMPRTRQQARIDELLDLVRLPRHYVDRYPHQLSGGEKQRVGIARTLALEPSVLVCDEATSALDVSVQAAILELLQDLRDRLGVAMLFISHDLAVVSQIADRVVVMRHGVIVEQGQTGALMRHPQHEYTRQLLASVPPFVAQRSLKAA